MSQTDGTLVTLDDGDGRQDTYRIYMLDPFEASDIAADLIGIIAPAMAALAGESKTGADELKAMLTSESLDGRALERAATILFSKFDKHKQRELINAMAKVTNVQIGGGGKEAKLPEVFTLHFRGRMGALYKWLFAALKVNFASFFASILPAIKAAVQSKAAL